MRIVGCGQLGKLVSSAFLKESWLSIPSGGKIPVVLEVYEGRDRPFSYAARLSAEMYSSDAGDSPEEAEGDYVLRYEGDSPEEALQNLGREDFEIVKIVDARRKQNRGTPLGIKTDREKTEEAFFDNPEVIKLLEGP